MSDGSTRRKMRMKSISLEDLGNIVKQMIGGALDDTERMAKLHRAIYEELCFEKMREFDGNNLVKKSSTSSSQKTLKVESIKCIEENGEHLKEDSRMNCIQQKPIIDTPSIGDDNRNIETIDYESVSKDIRPKQKRNVTQKHFAKVQSKLSLEEHAERKEQAFDIWKKEKTRSMRKALKEERRKRREELEARKAEIEKKQASHEEYLRSKKLQKRQRKFEELQRRAIKDAFLEMQEKRCEKTVANEEAFKAWKQQKDQQSRQRCCHQRKQRTRTKATGYCNDAEFDLWLDQLDSVLHQKYLRERRYLVRSFYCQPAYYGSAALSIQ